MIRFALQSERLGPKLVQNSKVLQTFDLEFTPPTAGRPGNTPSCGKMVRKIRSKLPLQPAESKAASSARAAKSPCRSESSTTRSTIRNGADGIRQSQRFGELGRGITLAQCSVCTRVSSTISEFDASVGVASALTEHSARSKAFVTERDGAGLCDFFPLAEHSGAGA